MKLDVTVLRYLSKEDFRILVAIEMGMKNHQLVPKELIQRIAKLHRGGAFKALSNVHKFKLVYHDAKKVDGYKLTYLGYDFLALRALSARGVVAHVGNQIGVGKESDIFVVLSPEQEHRCLKLHRLGRVSFRTIKHKRDYLQHRKSASWLYLSRLAALKEFAYMKVLHDHGFPVPKPYDVNRHCVVMELVDAHLLSNVSEIGHVEKVFQDLMQLLVRLAKSGLIHCDFNEFNLMIDDQERITLIDFPQMVSTSHPNAQFYWERDVDCVRTYFEKRYNYVAQEWPLWGSWTVEEDLGAEVEASGYDSGLNVELEQALAATGQGTDGQQEGEDVGAADKQEAEEDEEEEEDEDEEDDKDEDEEEEEGGDDDDEETPVVLTKEEERRQLEIEIKRKVKRQVDKERARKAIRKGRRKNKGSRPTREALKDW